jgi:hypothetical protein
MLTLSASNVEIRDTLPRSVLQSLRRRLKKLKRGEAMRSTIWARKKKAQSKRKCYSCWKRGHIARSCPLGNNSKAISIDDDIMLRKDSNGTSLVAIAKHLATYSKAMPKYVAPNLRGPKLVWVPSKNGWMLIGTMALEAWFKWYSLSWSCDWDKYCKVVIIIPMPWLVSEVQMCYNIQVSYLVVDVYWIIWWLANMKVEAC